MQITKTAPIFLFMIYFGICSPVNAKQDQVAPEKMSDMDSSNNKSKLTFPILLDELEQNNTADEALWIDVAGNRHLILTRLNNGRKERGNILLFHSQGENSDHVRLIQPLSKQLSRLGWNLFIPNIALENFPQPLVTKNSNQQQELPENTSNKLSEQEKTNTEVLKTENNDSKDNDSSNLEGASYYFKNSQAYQDYFSSLCQAVLEQTEVSKQPFVIIANQNAAYWSLSCLNQVNQSVPTIFLQPQLPIGVEDNLIELFAKQKNPIFSFRIKSSLTDPFSDAFKKRVWHSGHQRFNIGMLGTTKLQAGNTVIARTITGWVDKQRKK